MYVCMHVCLSVCLYVCMCACACACAWAWARACACACVCVSVCLGMSRYVCLGMSLYGRVCLNVWLYVCMLGISTKVPRKRYLVMMQFSTIYRNLPQLSAFCCKFHTRFVLICIQLNAVSCILIQFQHFPTVSRSPLQLRKTLGTFG